MVSLIDTIDAAAEKQKQLAVAASSSSSSSASPASSDSSASKSNLTASGKPKEKRRNNEKRKEKSRDAARCRRSKETEIFMELSQALPLKTDDVNQLDKASVMRITIAFLKIREMMQFVPSLRDCNEDIKQDIDAEQEVKPKLEIGSEEWLNGAEASQLLKQTLDGFLLVLSHEGDIIYVTENVVEYLGITKIDTLGQQIWEYSHQCDHAEIKEALSLKKEIANKVKDEKQQQQDSAVSTHHRDLFVRLKCTLTNRGRSINIKSASYKVIHITGHLVVNAKGERLLIAVGRPIPHPSNIEIPLGTSTFLTKHSLDMRFTYVDDKMHGLLGYTPSDLLDTSLFVCQHGADSERLMATFKSVLSKGQGETCRYRFLGKYGGYCWIVSQATIVYDKLKPQSVVCVNYVISNLENKHEIYSLAQQTAASEQKEQHHQPAETEQEPEKPATTELKQATKEPNEAAAPPLELEDKLEPELVLEKEPEKANEETPLELPETKIITANPPATPTTAITAATQIKQLPESNPLKQILQAELLIKRENHSPGPRTITATLLSGTSGGLRHEEKRPKSVTASVFRPNPAPPLTLPTSAVVVVGKKPQLQVEPTLPPTTTATAAIISSSNQQHQQQQQHQSQNPQPAQDMNKGFCSLFADDGRGLTMLKEEPDDLSHHLASTTCIQLDEMTPFSDMLVGLMSSCLLPDDINSLDSTTCSTTASGQHYQNPNSSSSSSINSAASSSSPSNSYATSPLSPLTPNPNPAAGTQSLNPSQQQSHNQQQQQQQHHPQHHDNSNSSSNIDPLLNYREESNDTSCSQHLHSPSITSKSPEDSSLPSLCSPNSLTQEDAFSFADFEMRAPYIPMGDDMPLLTETDLMWCPPEDLQTMVPKEIDAMQQQLQQLQQQHHQQYVSNSGYQQQQQQQQSEVHQQQHFSNSLCSSPASTVSSLSPSPVQQQHQQQQQAAAVFSTDSSELAALLCGSGNGTLSILGGSGVTVAEECNERLQHQQQQQQGNNDFRSFQQLQQELQLQEEQLQDQQRQQQQQQQQLLSLSIECKKEKYEVPMAPSLCHSMEEAFENDYSKDSTNLDCWDLLQMHVAEAPVSPAASPAPCKVTTIQLLQQQQQQQQQNIILNAVPLITIQNNKGLMQQQQQQEQLQQPALKILNGASIAPVTTKATIRLVESKPAATQQQRKLMLPQQQQQQQHGNKRHLNSATGGAGNPVESKRLKSGTICLDVQSPQLLQQLIGKDQVQQNQATKRAGSERWQQQAAESKQQKQQQQQQQQQQSNSVLKNLLVSGRDASDSEPMMIDDNSLEAQTLDMGKYGLPLHCHTATSTVLRNYHHNPLISGTNFQLSPVFGGSDAGGGVDCETGSVVSLDDSMPPGLTACDTDASSDSGIDENSVTGSPRKRIVVESRASSEPPPPLDVVPSSLVQTGDEELESGAGGGSSSNAPSRKTSISFLDSSNPLLHTPAMMDLCNDDYIMGEGGFEFSDNQLEQVLGWPEIA